MNPILSIVIPTKNRQKYCLAAIEQIISLGLNNVEIVIQDNSDDASLKEAITPFLDNNRIIYNYQEGVLSFVDNFSEAVVSARGEYLCMIGDDDGILPNIIDIVEFAKKHDYDAIVPGLNSFYCWPSEDPFIKGAGNGYLCVSYVNSRRYDVDVQDALNKLLSHGGQDYQSLNLPRLYHGVVARKALKEVYERTGTYFDGLTPDIYIAVALCFTCKRVCRTCFPITIPGICPRCGSSDSATGKHTGELKDAPHFRGHDSYEWNDRVPAIYSVESIWAETVLHALHNFGAENLYEKFRVDVLDGICLAHYPQFRRKIKAHSKKYGISSITLGYQRMKSLIVPVVRRVIRRALRKPGDVSKYYDIENIRNACTVTMNVLTSKAVKLKE